jgi:hypothetical protein
MLSEWLLFTAKWPVFAHTPLCCVLSGETVDANSSLWFDPTATGTHESTTLDANNYTTDAV